MKIFFLPILSLIILLTSCYSMKSSSGGGQDVNFSGVRIPDPDDVALPEGFMIEVVASGLTFPTGITFDETGKACITESGYSYGEVFKEPKLIRINQDGTKETILTGTQNGPWNGVWFSNGYFYIAEGGQLEGGKILKADMQGNINVLVDNLPSLGDHHTNGPVVHQGYVWFGQGTATNSSVVGIDNYQFGWLKRYSDFHDIPCMDIKLAGVNFTTENALEEGSSQELQTGAYLPYGVASEPGQRISGAVPCSGAIMRVPLQGGEPELVAWGFRNPYGLAFNSKDQLFITDNGYDDRGSRPVWGTGDYLWKINQGQWYGWPDYSGGHEINTRHFKVPDKGIPPKVLAEDPNKPPHPAARLGVHSSSNGFDFSRSEYFGFKDEAFVAQFGDMAPGVGKVYKPVGYKVVRVNTETGVIYTFAVNKKDNLPASKLNSGGIERPVAVRFSPDGNSLYIVDYGIMLTSEEGPKPIEETGVIWKISKQEK